MKLTIYLAGEIHGDWRNQLKEQSQNLPLEFVEPQTNHDYSDNIGNIILGKQPNKYYEDEAASKINNLRTRLLMKKSDVVIAFFGENYKQWNTAMDATSALELDKPLIIIRPETLSHPLKELSSRSDITVESINQALDVIKYIYE